MSDQPPPVPFGFVTQIDRLFAALKEAESLLTTGRAWGLTIALSPALAAQIGMRFGDHAELVLNNTQRVDPNASYSRVSG